MANDTTYYGRFAAQGKGKNLSKVVGDGNQGDQKTDIIRVQ